MNWLDPRECIAAREAIQAGQFVEAARLLLESRHAEHRSARELLREVSPLLVGDASKLVEMDLEAARDRIELASRCATLSVDALSLKTRIERRLQEKQQQQEFQRQRVDEASKLAKVGRIVTAVGLLDDSTSSPAAEQLRMELEEKRRRFERYLRECQSYLDQEEWDAAQNRWDKARGIIPDAPELLVLKKRLPNVFHPEREPLAPQVRPGRTVNRQDKGILLGDLALVLFQPVITFGTPRDDSVDIPMLAKIHRQHCRIRRDGGRHWLETLPDCPLAINGRSLNGSCELRDGDQISLGNENVVWTFHRLAAWGATALLRRDPRTPGPVRLPCGADIACVVMMGNDFSVEPTRPGNIVVPHLPCRRIRFLWREDQLHAELTGGAWSNEMDDWPSVRPISLSDRFVVHGRLGGPDWLGRAASNLKPLDQMSLTIRAPYDVQGQI